MNKVQEARLRAVRLLLAQADRLSIAERNALGKEMMALGCELAEEVETPPTFAEKAGEAAFKLLDATMTRLETFFKRRDLARAARRAEERAADKESGTGLFGRGQRSGLGDTVRKEAERVKQAEAERPFPNPFRRPPTDSSRSATPENPAPFRSSFLRGKDND